MTTMTNNPMFSLVLAVVASATMLSGAEPSAL